MTKHYKFSGIELEVDNDDYINVGKYGKDLCSKYLSSTTFSKIRKKFNESVIRFNQGHMWIRKCLIFDFLRVVDTDRYFKLVEDHVTCNVVDEGYDVVNDFYSPPPPPASPPDGGDDDKPRRIIERFYDLIH